MEPQALAHPGAASGIAPRAAFLCPRYPLLRHEGPADWAAVAPVPLLTDGPGEHVPAPPATIRLAWDDHRLHLHAHVPDAKPVLDPALSPDHRDFWRQDHLEWRLLPDPARPLEQTQVILLPDGRWFDNRGWWRDASAVQARGERTAEGWTVTASLPWSALGWAPAEGRVLHGLVAHTRWADGSPTMAMSSAAELGFGQAERFGQWVLSAAPRSVPRLTAVAVAPGRLGTSTAAQVVLSNAGGRRCAGWLRITSERGRPPRGETVSRWLDLPPGVTRVDVALALDRWRFTRYRFTWTGADGTHELGAVSLRAGVPSVMTVTAEATPGARGATGVPARAHPFLLFTPARLEAMRAKAQRPAFAPWVAQLEPTPADLSRDDLPALDAPPDFHFGPGDVGWFRFCKETLLRDGARGRAPVPARLWALLPADARAAAEQIVRTVTPTDEALAALLAGLNALLDRPDLADAETFARVALAPEVRAALERGRDADRAALPAHERQRFNRTLLQSALEFVPSFGLDLPARAARCLRHWVLHRDDRLIDVANHAIHVADRQLILGPHVDLREGGVAMMLALAYDTFAPHLRDDDRAVWRRVLGQFLEVYLHTARTAHWNSTTIANANPVINSGGGMVGLALLDEHPDAPEAVDHARTMIRRYLDYAFGPDGGCTEGMRYFDYGGTHFLRFVAAMECALGTDDGLFNHPHFRVWMNNLRVSICNDGKLHGMNDTIPVPHDVEPACFFAGRFNDPLALWWSTFAEQVRREMLDRGKPCPGAGDPLFCLAFRPDRPAAPAPPLPTAFALHDIEYGVLRSAPRHDCRITAGLKGNRPPYTHHAQADTGAFFIHLRGERLMIDPGYYKGAATDHSLPIIAGVAPAAPNAEGRYDGNLIACETRGDLRWLACDSTAAYRGAAARVVRHLVVVGDEGVLLLDDIVLATPAAGEPATAHGDGAVLAQYQCGGPTVPDPTGRCVTIRGQHAQLRMELLTRPDLALRCHEERTLHDVHWGYHFAECRWFPVTGPYAPDERDPLLTAWVDATDHPPHAASSSSVSTSAWS